MSATQLDIRPRERASTLWSSAREREPDLRLLCFPFAGGGSWTFVRWHAGLPQNLEVCAAQYPGRGNARDEAPFRRIPDLVQRAADDFEPFAQTPTAVFGHSFGAIVAFGFVRELRRRGWPTPHHLFLGGILPPHRLSDVFETLGARTEDLSDADFMASVGHKALNGNALAHSEELAEATLPALRADTEALTAYRFTPEEPLTTNLSVYVGSEDPYANAESLAGWSEHSSGRFELRELPGGHWFPETNPEPLLDRLRGRLRRVLRRLAEERDGGA